MDIKQTLFDELESRLCAVADPLTLTGPQRENLWLIAVQTYYAALLAGQKSGPAKKAISAWLWQRVPSLAKSCTAIFRQLYRKINAKDLTDRRRTAGAAKRAAILSAEDRTALVQQAVFECGGIVDFAWQECLRKKLLSHAVLKRYSVPSNRRPSCPKAIRRQVTPEIRQLFQQHVRPHHFSNNIAPMTRDWSNVFAQDIYECDDKTLDVYCRIATEENGRIIQRKSRCQFLPMIDAKSGKILDFVLIGEANYNAVSIRTLIKKTCLKYGLPSVKFQFERGMWKNAKLLGNNKSAKPFAEVENFATRCGVKLCHALPGRARSKFVETVFRLLDRKMYGWPGYAGNDEQHNKFERTERMLNRMDAADYDPAKPGQLFTFDELMSNLIGAVEDYNNTPSDSIVKGGYKTPNEVWENCRRKNAQGETERVAMLPPQFEYLLASHCSKVIARLDGVKISLGKQTYHFHAPGLVDLVGSFIGQWVKVWFDPEFPETAVATDLKEREFFPLVRVPAAPANAQTAEDWSLVARAGEPYRTAARQPRQRYSDLKKTYIAPARPVISDVVMIERSQRMGETQKQAAHLAKRTETVDFAKKQERSVLERQRRAWALYDLRMQTEHLFGESEKPTPPDFPRPATENDLPSRAESAAVVVKFVNAR